MLRIWNIHNQLLQWICRSCFNTPIQISKYIILYLLCWLRGKSELPLLNDKVKVVNSCLKNIIDLKMCIKGSWISALLPLQVYILIGVRIKRHKNINCVSVEFFYFQKPPRQVKGSLIMNYIQEHVSDSE